MSVSTACVAATATAITWLGFAWLTGYGLGPLMLLLAIGISLLLRGSVDGGGLMPGAVGAVLILLVMLVGRLWIVDRIERRATEQAIALAVDDTAMLLGLAQQIAQRHLDAGNPLALPGGRELPEGAATIEFAARNEVPDDIWQQAESLWRTTAKEHRVAQTTRRKQFVAEVRERSAPKDFAARFGIAGLFWATAATGTAFLIGSRAAT